MLSPCSGQHIRSFAPSIEVNTLVIIILKDRYSSTLTEKTMKVTVWNIKMANGLVANPNSNNNKSRIKRIERTIKAIDPDVLCVVEGPKGENGIKDFAQKILNNKWSPVLLGQNKDSAYKQKGTQWIWFLVKPGLLGDCDLQDPALWQDYTDQKTWLVNYWGQKKPARHSHYRHPQVLRVDIGSGQEVEIIGVHLKSKINQEKITTTTIGGQPQLTGAYLDTALKARTKLATEARDVRRYISYRFQQSNPGMLIVGDCNDGPGLDYFEDRYLYFDLISNLQGQIMNAEEFFNHCLFDFNPKLRWSAKFTDPIFKKVFPSKYVKTGNKKLIDHILMSQALVNGSMKYQVKPKSGRVEHEAFDRANQNSNYYTVSSDHRPVSVIVD